MSDSTLNDWQDYHGWCRLCGTFDATLTPHKETQEIILQIINVMSLNQNKRIYNTNI